MLNLSDRKIITPPACRAWRSYKLASLSFSVFLFFRCSKLGYRSCVIPLCILLSEPVSPRLFNSIPSKLCHQNTHFNMYTTTSKGSTWKDSYPNCFIATNSTAKLWQGEMNAVKFWERVPLFSLCFHFPLKFVHIDQTRVLPEVDYFYWNISTKHSF